MTNIVGVLSDVIITLGGCQGSGEVIGLVWVSFMAYQPLLVI